MMISATSQQMMAKCLKLLLVEDAGNDVGMAISKDLPPCRGDIPAFTPAN